MSLRKVYEACRDEGEVGNLARTLLAQQDWFASVAEFDPRTSYALPLGLDEVLRRLASPPKTPYVRDRLWRIVEHSRTSVERIFGALREDPRREQAVLPIRDVRELDAASFIALSRRPGRSIREKLAGKPYMQAVRRYQSVDLPENRLLKEYITQLADFLELRVTYLGHEDEILAEIYRWLRSDEAQAVGQWGNTPPNNTLLAHKDYRRVWDAWRALQTLDLSTDDHLKNLESRADTVAQWTQYANAHADGLAVFGDLPVLFDYDAFSITPWEGRPIVADARESPRKPRVRTPIVRSPVCVDLTTLHPRYSTDGATAAVMTESFLWQRWHGGQGVQDLELFEADAAIVSTEATTLTWGDLTTVTDEISSDVIGAAALAFTRRLSATFMHPALITLVPDPTNDFQMEAVRRHINSRFAQAEPLPRSIAAAIEHVDYSRIARDGFEVLVVDTVGAVTSATKLTAKHDPELAARVPQTRGFYWERAPHIALRSAEPTTSVLRQMLTVDDQEFWYDAVPTAPAEPVSVAALHRNTAVGTFDYVINVDESPVVGGMRLFNLQLAAGDIPLWRDQIPELSIKIHVGRRFEPFYLVHRGTTVRPVLGQPVAIRVDETFTLDAGRNRYQFALFQGSDGNDLGYVARLESSDFPLETDSVYDLDMSYTYGADEPYRLVFRPRDPSLRPVQATWRLKTDEEITEAPGPEYPAPETWGDLQHHRSALRGSTTNYLDWAASKTKQLIPRLAAVGTVHRAVIATPWKVNPNGQHFTFASDSSGVRYYIHEFGLAGDADTDTVGEGDEIWFVLESGGDRPRTTYVATSADQTQAAASKDIRRSLYVPYIKVWADGRSTSDTACPSTFRDAFTSLLPELLEVWTASDTPRNVRSDVGFLFACMHRDMPTAVSDALVRDVLSGRVDEKATGFALGDLSAAWQQSLFAELLRQADERSLRVFARAIWRSPMFVDAFDATALRLVANKTADTLLGTVRHNNPSPMHGPNIARYCELLLGLLRSRQSSRPEVSTVLQPSQDTTQKLIAAVADAAGFVARQRLAVESRVELNVPDKPADDETPDLLYGLHLYLTGDMGANAIRVTGVSDSEDT